MKTLRPLKRVVIREELRELTGAVLEALVLGQLLYWTQRVRDLDQLLQEEKERMGTSTACCADRSVKLTLRHGWIYRNHPILGERESPLLNSLHCVYLKKAEELAEELMIDQSVSTLRRALVRLTERGWLSERANPKSAWDRTKQYRVNLVKLQRDLAELGYPLEEYALEPEGCDEGWTAPVADTSGQGQALNRRSERSSAQPACTGEPMDCCSDQTDCAIPETTSEITSEITTEKKTVGRAGEERSGVEYAVDAGWRLQKPYERQTPEELLATVNSAPLDFCVQVAGLVRKELGLRGLGLRYVNSAGQFVLG